MSVFLFINTSGGRVGELLHGQYLETESEHVHALRIRRNGKANIRKNKKDNRSTGSNRATGMYQTNPDIGHLPVLTPTFRADRLFTLF